MSSEFKVNQKVINLVRDLKEDEDIIGIGGWDYRSSPIKVFEWDLNYLGLELEDRGFFKHIG